MTDDDSASPAPLPESRPGAMRSARYASTPTEAVLTYGRGFAAKSRHPWSRPICLKTMIVEVKLRVQACARMAALGPIVLKNPRNDLAKVTAEMEFSFEQI